MQFNEAIFSKTKLKKIKSGKVTAYKAVIDRKAEISFLDEMQLSEDFTFEKLEIYKTAYYRGYAEGLSEGRKENTQRQ